MIVTEEKIMMIATVRISTSIFRGKRKYTATICNYGNNNLIRMPCIKSLPIFIKDIRTNECKLRNLNFSFEPLNFYVNTCDVQSLVIIF